MITLFKPDETDFAHNGLGSLDRDIIDPVVSEDLNGIYQFTFKYPIFAAHGSEINGQSVIRVPTPDEEDQLFRVFHPVKSMGYLTVSCYHIFYDLIDNFIEDTNIVGKNGQGAITQLIGATQYGHSFRAFSDIQTISNARIVRMNPIEALIDDETENSFVRRWGGELKRNNFDIRMNKSIGSNRGKEIRHRKDLVGYEADVDWSAVTTRIMPKGFDGLLLPEKYVDSLLISKYVYPKIKVIEYSDIKAAVGEYVNDEDAVPLDEAYALLRLAAKAEFDVNHVDVPPANYKVDFVTLDKTEEYKDLEELQKVYIGDTVTVIHEDDGINIEAKVISYKYQPIAEKYLGIELGNFTDSLTKTYTDIQNLSRKVDNISEIANIVQSTADGKNTIYRGENEPNDPNLNDLWYKPNGSETEMYQYVEENGQKYWKIIANTAELSTVKKEVESVIDQADADRAKTEQNITQAVADAQTYTNTKAQEFDNKLVAVNQEVANVTQSANAAISKADQAIQDVGFMQIDVATAKTNVTTALENANTAKSNASTALTNAETAISTANTAKSNAGTALSNSNAALNRVGFVEETTGALSTSYDVLTKTVALKADQTTVDGIKGTVTTQGIAITANATVIGLKADKSVVDTINGTVANHTTDIKANSDGLKLKADSTTVNSIKGTVDTHTTQIKAASDGLTLKADKSQVDTIKGTVDKHTLDISANATAVGLKADKSVVDSIKGTVDKHTLDIKAAADGLTLKADSSLVNTLKGTVDTHTTQISANSTAINARLTSAQVETLLTGKKYVNETTLNATATGIRADITQVSNDLSDLEIGGRNYLKDTNYDYRTASWSSWDYRLATVYVTENSDIKFGDEVTFSVYLKPSKGNAAAFIDARDDSNNYIQFTGNYIESGEGLSTVTVKIPSRSNEGNPITRIYIAIRNGKQATMNAVTDYKKYKLENGNKATDWTPAPEDMATLEQFTTIDATVKGLQVTVGNKAEQSQVTQLAGQINSKVESATYNSKMTQLDSAINLRVTKGDVTAQINVEAGVTLISNKKLLLDANTYIMGTTFANDVKAKSLEAVYADIATLKTKVLTADVVTSTMLKSDTALIDKIFATDANVNRLTAKTAFINSVKAIDIAADRITTGTLNAANVNIINLNANNIVSGTIKAINYENPFSYNDSIGYVTGTTYINNGGFNMVGIDSSGKSRGIKLAPGMMNTSFGDAKTNVLAGRVEMTSTEGGNGLIFYSPTKGRYYSGGYNGWGLGIFRLTNSGATEEFKSLLDVETDWNGYEAVVANATFKATEAKIDYFKTTKSIEFDGAHSIYSSPSNEFILNGSKKIMLAVNNISALYIDGISGMTYSRLPLEMGGHAISNVVIKSTNSEIVNIARAKSISFDGSHSIYVNTSNQLIVSASKKMMLAVNDFSSIFIDGISAMVYCNLPLDMGGHKIYNSTIVNSSDLKLKKDVRKVEIDTFEIVKNIDFIDYIWDKDLVENKGLTEGRMFGISAQSAPFLQTKNGSGEYLAIDVSKQIILNTLTSQQLIEKSEALEKRIEKLEREI